MKTKKRNIGGASDTTTSAIYKKKITTRNMHNSSSKQQSDTGGSGLCSLGNSKKPSPITRAKSSCVIKSHSDPYAFTKLDDDDKIPMKKMKVHEKTGKEIGVNTSSLSTMTEPEYLGPCEPGTSIELQGIVWLETATGLLVINVTWRGRTYVGTLMDSTKYEFTPSFSQENFGKFEGRPPNRSTRGKKRQVGNTGNHFSLRSNNIRHSRRLSESHNNDNILKKSSTRQTNNLVNYFESTNQSATASASGESDTDKNSYSKYPPNNKTRSVTRSITKLKKAILCDSNPNSADDNSGNLIKCSKANCYKRFVDMTAFQYHVQRCHNISELSNVSPEYKVMEPVNDISNTNKGNFLKLESSYEENNKINCAKESQLHETFLSKSSNCKLNGIIKKEIDVQVNSFDYNSDSEMEKNHNLASYDFGESNQDPKITESENSDQIIESKSFTKTENLSPKFQELSITLPKVSDNSLSNSDDVKKTINSSSKEIGPSVSEDKYLSITSDSQISVSKSLSTSMKTTSQNSFESYSTTIMSQSTPCIRTVTAPTVSIPVELVNTPNTLINSTVSCPTLIRPKPNQSTVSSVTHSSPNRKFKSSKSHSQTNGILDSFQIPSSSSLILKKRPLIPLKVSVNQTSNSNLNRIYPITSQINVTSSNQTSRHIRSSSISPVTPILPATSTVNSSASLITSTTTVTGTSINSSMNNIFHNGPLSIRRPSTTTNLTTGPALSTLVSLKPIQPKPKCSQSSAPITTSHIGINASSYPASQSIIVPNISGIPNIHVSHQRQILPSPITKSDFSTNIDESLIHKIESLKTSSLKRKRRKPEKKLRLNFHESNRYKKFALNPIQPKHVTNDHFISKMNNSDDFCLSVDKYKTDEENSHSPGYSDLSETNDTPAPILEKEIDLKSGECDKLVICTDFDRISTYHHNSSSSENYDDPKDLSNKPPALMPAVLSSDLVNGSTNELDYRDVKPRSTRKKNITNKKSHKLKDSAEVSANQNKSNGSEWMTTLTGKAKSSSVSNHKSFQSSSNVRQNISPVPLFSSPKSPTISLQSRDYSSSETNSKLVSVNRNLIPSAINDFVRTNKIKSDTEKNLCSNKSVETALQSLQPSNEDKGKGRNKTVSSPQINNNGKFSVQALTSPQEIVSRSLSFATSSTVSSIIPNTKLSNVLFKH